MSFRRGDTIFAIGPQGEIVTAVVMDVSGKPPDKGGFVLQKGVDYGPQLKQIREMLNLPLRSVAKQADVSPNTVWRIEHGMPCNESSAMAILNALNRLAPA